MIITAPIFQCLLPR